jgi:NADH-quinone oxidoreductase subunit G
LGNLLDLTDFDYQSSEQVRDELQVLAEKAPSPAVSGEFNATGFPPPEPLRDVPTYQVDPLVRRASALQLTRVAREPPLEFLP